MSCVMSAKYQITHAGREFGSIISERGIRHGDPLSSYLFLICTEGLTALIKKYERSGLIQGVKVARGAPSLTHMFFADDSYVFCKADTSNAEQVVHMLLVFEHASGQQVNRAKSSVFFSKNVDVTEKDNICGILNFQEADERSTYLGLPNIIGRNKTSMFGYIKDKVQGRVEGWDKQYLSRGGKEILLKTVAQAMPTYAMSVFIQPLELCKDLERIMCKFWWRTGHSTNRGIHWMSWERLSKRKTQGGMGFRSVHDYNVAMVGKQGWRLIMNPESLFSRIYRARYYPRGTFLNAKLGSNPSYIWRSVLEAQELLKMHTA